VCVQALFISFLKKAVSRCHRHCLPFLSSLAFHFCQHLLLHHHPLRLLRHLLLHRTLLLPRLLPLRSLLLLIPIHLPHFPLLLLRHSFALHHNHLLPHSPLLTHLCHIHPKPIYYVLNDNERYVRRGWGTYQTFFLYNFPVR
jgi:hypothetical protein